VEVLSGSEDERGAWFSPAYGVKVPSKLLRMAREIEGRHNFVTTLSASAQVEPVVSVHGDVLRARIRRGEGVEEALTYGADNEIADLTDVRFRGTLLFQRTVNGAPDLVRAARFRELSIEGVLDVESAEVVDSLVFSGDRCAIAARAGAGAVRVRASTRVRVEINGSPRSADAS